MKHLLKQHKNSDQNSYYFGLSNDKEANFLLAGTTHLQTSTVVLQFY